MRLALGIEEPLKTHFKVTRILLARGLIEKGKGGEGVGQKKERCELRGYMREDGMRRGRSKRNFASCARDTAQTGQGARVAIPQKQDRGPSASDQSNQATTTKGQHRVRKGST